MEKNKWYIKEWGAQIWRSGTYHTLQLIKWAPESSEIKMIDDEEKFIEDFATNKKYFAPSILDDDEGIVSYMQEKEIIIREDTDGKFTPVKLKARSLRLRYLDCDIKTLWKEEEE